MAPIVQPVCTAAVQCWGYCAAVVLQFVLLLCSGVANCTAICTVVCTAAVQWWGKLYSQLCCSLYCCCAVVGQIVQPVVLQFVLLLCSGGAVSTAVVLQFVLPKLCGSNMLIEKFRDFPQYLWAVS